MLAQPLMTRNIPPFPPDHNQAADQYAPQTETAWSRDVPMQRPYAKTVGSYTGGLTYAQHELLRQRKTPSGRETESLDIANIDENLQLPASKHVLLSTSPTEHLLPQGHSIAGRRFLSASRPYVYSRPPVSLSAYRNDNGSAEPAWSFPGGHDGMLIQPSSQTALYNSRSQVPTVMPTALRGSFGPPVSAGQQYYGPYWPDGTFSPYRPAPMRDDRFFHWRQSRDMNRDSESNFGQNFLGPPDMRPDHNFRTGPRTDSPMAHETRTMQTLPPRDGYRPYASFQDRIASALDRPQIDPGVYSSTTTYGPYSNEAQGLVPHLDDFSLHSTTSSERIANRESTFSWAYRVYIDLLAQIQRDAKLIAQQAGVSGKARLPGKPAIFPKPPQRSTSHLADYKGRELGQLGARLPTQPYDSLPANTAEFADRPTTAMKVPRRASDFASHLGRTATRECEADTTLPSRDYDTAFFSRPMLHGLCPPTPNDIPNAYQSTANAVAALDTLESLCLDTEVAWTDGMLLAGCLAYGIGNYSRALAWYQKVIKRDTGHIEALSNLAATFLALGRREEAAAHWSTAIKLRPSYFEAVEHLVGLLVGSHRTKEAVDIIEHIQSCLKLASPGADLANDDDSDSLSRTSSATISSAEGPSYDFDIDRRFSRSSTTSENMVGFGTFGYAIPAADNGRLLALIHAKGNMLYSLGDNRGAAAAFEDAILIAAGDRRLGIRGLIDKTLRSCISSVDPFTAKSIAESKEPILLSPERAQRISQRMFPHAGEMPGLALVPTIIAYKAAISTTSNSLLSLAKIYQDGLSQQASGKDASSPGTREILALYYLSLSLQPSPSTANNVGILLASVQSTTVVQVLPQQVQNRVFNYAGVAPGSGVALALAYYNYGLQLDGKHAHLYTNLGSLLKDLGELQAAIKMYETAVECDGNFDIALANLANAVKDQGRIADAIKYYKRAVQANPDFAEAVCGLATALNSVCDWFGRGGVFADGGLRDRVHVDERGMMQRAQRGFGWMNKVVEIVDRQLRDGEGWAMGVLTPDVIDIICRQLTIIRSDASRERQMQLYRKIQQCLQGWSGRRWEGSRLVRLLERATKRIGWQWYQDRYVLGKEYPARRYARPSLPANVPVPGAPTVLPFHTFTTPLSAKQVRHISQRNALRISVSTMKSSWLSRTVYPPPRPPKPCLHVGYISSDFNNHPLAHLMQSIFGLHDTKSVRAYCYATTASDGSIHRNQIEREAPVFHNVSTWNVAKLVNQIVEDGIHILINLNGYTRGARNEVFAARPAPIHMSFMGFAGTLGAEWCDYVYADEISVCRRTLAPYRSNVDIEDKLDPRSQAEDLDDWIYAENVIFSSSSFFCVDHKQSAPDAKLGTPRLDDRRLADEAWRKEQVRRWKLRKELFPLLPDDAVIFGNFNQLYKIDPSTFRLYLKIVSAVPNAILWLLRFPDVGEQNLLSFAREWAGDEVAKRVVFTDVAPKGTHITRASVVDLFLDTPECNAHTTAADVIWSGTPIITWARWEYKMCSRMASSIVASALPVGHEGDEARRDLLVRSEQEYEEHAVALASTLTYPVTVQSYISKRTVTGREGQGVGRLMELRRMLWEGRWTSRLFDTKRWVQDLEAAYWVAWNNWVDGKGGDIWL